MIAQRPRSIEDARAFAFGTLEQPRRGHVLDIERRILAHHDGAEVAQRNYVPVDFDEPVVVVGKHFQVHRFGADAMQRREMDRLLLHSPDRMRCV